MGIDASAWHVEHEPSKSGDHLTSVATDVRFTGLGLQARLTGEGGNTAYLARTAVNVGRVHNDELRATRLAVSGELRGRLSATLGPLNISTVAGLQGDAGETDGQRWRRATGSVSLSLGAGGYQLRGDWMRGSVTASRFSYDDGLAAEQFVVGGSPNPLIDQVFMSQRIPLPALPAGFVSGRAFQLFKATLGGNPWEPYFLWVNDGHALEHLARVAGIERTFGITSLGFARLPGLRARAGASYSFDEPYADRARLHASLTFTP